MNQYFEEKTKKSLDNDILSVQTYNDTCIKGTKYLKKSHLNIKS